MGVDKNVKLIVQANFDTLENIFIELGIDYCHPKPLWGKKPLGRWLTYEICPVDWSMEQMEDHVRLSIHFACGGENPQSFIRKVLRKLKPSRGTPKPPSTIVINSTINQL